MRSIVTAAALAFGLALAGCESFDPLDKCPDSDIMGSSKKPLPGERRAGVPGGVPGVAAGRAARNGEGLSAAARSAAAGGRSKSRVKAEAEEGRSAHRASSLSSNSSSSRCGRRRPRRPRPRNRSRQNAGRCQTMPGAQPTWPTNAPPAPGPWVGPQR